MTRSLLIFGQGAILCHPWVLKEMKAAQDPDEKAGLEEFDRNLFGHIGFAISNAVRSFWFGLTGAKIGKAPGDDYTRRYFRKLDRYSANLARSEEHTSELQSLMRISYAVFCLKNKNITQIETQTRHMTATN